MQDGTDVCCRRQNAEGWMQLEIQLWKEQLVPYQLAVKELVVKFEDMISQYKQAGLYSPIEQVEGRVKTLSSILEKARKKGIPIEEATERLEDIAGITRQLLACGADIVEINTLRKHLSAVKGGRFAERCAPAKSAI